jgi:uncharacterized protein (TIGR01777 family)
VIVALTGARGFIGSALAARLQAGGHVVRAISLRSGLRASDFADCDAVVNLAGEPVAQRWTKEARRRIRESRIEGTRALVAALREHPPSTLVNASAIGYYGSRGDEILTESSAPAADFLGQLAVEWENEARAAEAFGTRVVLPRFGVVLGRGGGALARLLPVFRLGIGGRLGSGRQWMSWIHLDDATALLEFAIVLPRLSGPVNAVAPAPVTNAEFARALGRALHRPAIFPVPAFVLRLLYGEMAGTILGSQRVLPEAAQRAGFTFRYPALEAALRQIAGS